MFKPDVLPDGRPIRLRQHGTSSSFFTKNFSQSEKFLVKKGWNLPPCRRRIGPVVQADA
jgi:hypothetical protein